MSASLTGRSHLRSPYSTKKPSFGFTSSCGTKTRSSIDYGQETEFDFFLAFTSCKPKSKWSLTRSAPYNTDQTNSNSYTPTAGNTSTSGLHKFGKQTSSITPSPSSILISTPFQSLSQTPLDEKSSLQTAPENTKADKIYLNLPITGEASILLENQAQPKKVEPVPRYRNISVLGT